MKLSHLVVQLLRLQENLKFLGDNNDVEVYIDVYEVLRFKDPLGAWEIKGTDIQLCDIGEDGRPLAYPYLEIE